MEEKELTTSEAAEVLNISPRYLVDLLEKEKFFSSKRAPDVTSSERNCLSINGGSGQKLKRRCKSLLSKCRS